MISSFTLAAFVPPCWTFPFLKWVNSNHRRFSPIWLTSSDVFMPRESSLVMYSFSCLWVLDPQHNPVMDKQFSDAFTEVACLWKCTQPSHICIDDAFQLLPFLGVVKWHSIEKFQSFSPHTVKKESDLIYLRKLFDVHYNCIVTLRLLECFPAFCNILFYIEVTWQVE